MDALAGYRITARLHDSALSTVYRAVREADGKPVVLKVLNPAYPPPERIAWFKREFDIGRAIEQAHVVRTLGLETDEYRWFMVLEDVAYESLASILASRGLSVRESLRVALGIVAGLDEVHQSNVVHKDINPSNVVCDPLTLDVKLIDFGVASVLPRQSAMLRNPDTLEGTLAYMSPEQTGRMNRAIDYRTDFYSLGVTLYEMLTGAPPFQSSDSMELVHCHLAREPVAVDERSSTVPGGVADVVGKLMAKTAEGRYQSAFGIKADLEECLRRLEGGAKGDAPFEVGRHDVYERFQIPHKLYGRERELDTLLAAFSRAAAEADTPREMMLVTGHSGIGKSALIRELYTPITESRGYFIFGKFDQLRRTRPYSAIVSAFRSLVQQLLTEGASELERSRDSLLSALGPNGRLVTEVIPEVELIVGPQPTVLPLGPMESENRFNFVFQNFVRALVQPGHPVVLFLDDLQWADSASLNLCRLIMQDSQDLSLLLIGAYRDNDVGPGHLLTVTVEKLRDEGAEIHQIHLGPLPLEHVAELILDTTGAARPSCATLARLVVEKTGGNPFFVSSFLNAAHQEGLIRLDRTSGHWRWEYAEIAARSFTDNVVDLTIGRLRRLPDLAQELLQLAACIGGSFALEPLAVTHESTPQETFDALLPAIQEGFVLATSSPEVVGEDGPLLAANFRFVHDRVQQAAYSLIEEKQREPLHLKIGRLMLESAAEEGLPEELFDIVGHLNVGRDLIGGVDERRQLATLNLEAARKAKAATAYAAANDYLQAALGLLSDSSWEDDYDLTLAVHQELVDAEYLNGHHDAAERLCKEMLERDLRAVDKADFYFRLVENYTLQARYQNALRAARSGLALVGEELPLDNVEEAVAATNAQIKRNLGDREISSLLHDPEITDPGALAATKLFRAALSAAFYEGPATYALVSFKSVDLFLRYGASSEASVMYAAYAMVVSSMEGDIRTGDALGRLALEQSERFNRLDNVCQSIFLWAGFVRHWTTHLPTVVESLERGYQAGLESGELRFAGYTLVYVLLDQYFLGRPLEELAPDLEEYLSFSRKTKSQLSIDCFTGTKMLFANLGADHEDPLTFATDTHTEDEYLAACTANQSWMAMCYFHICKRFVLYLYRADPRTTLEASTLADEYLPNIMGNFAESLHNLHTSLVLAACLDGATADERREFLGRIESNQAQLRVWAESCPENFLHMVKLVEAELARDAGDIAEAMALYEQAVTLARKNRFAVHEALANELAGRLKLRQALEQGARESLTAAHYGYRLWGARHKVAALEDEFDWLADGPQPATVTSPAVRALVGTTSAQAMSTSLDLGSVMKASQAISGEIVLDRLLERLMTIVIENAGAQRGVLVLDSDGKKRVQAVASVETGVEGQSVSVDVLQAIPLEEFGEIPSSVANYVTRSGEAVIENDVLHDGSFTRDPYIQRARPRSVLCAPLSGHGKFVGFIYLENGLVTDAFTADRLKLLQMLSSQFAISLENARLYDDMERQVEQRTVELSQKNAALEQALQDLKSTQAQLVHSEKMASLGQLTAGVAHEINNPLNFVNNFAQLGSELLDELAQERDANPEIGLAEVTDVLSDLRVDFETISKHGKRAAAIVSNMLQHARGSAGEREEVDLNDFVEQYINLANFGARKSSDDVPIAVELRFDEAAGRVAILPQEFGQVLVNLLNNAYDAVRARLRQDPGSADGVITIGTRRADGWVEVRVADNGPGIPRDLHEKIFQPFFTTKHGKEGTGLGLSLCYEIMVTGHDGRLSLETELGEGTTFIASLPTGL